MKKELFTHPGESLKEFMKDHQLSELTFSKHIKVPFSKISKIIDGVQPITTEIAYKISKYYPSLTYTFLMNLQINYDYKVLKHFDKDEDLSI